MDAIRRSAADGVAGRVQRASASEEVGLRGDVAVVHKLQPGCGRTGVGVHNPVVAHRADDVQVSPRVNVECRGCVGGGVLECEASVARSRAEKLAVDMRWAVASDGEASRSCRSIEG